MKKQFVHILFAVLAMSTVLVSCKKDSDNHSMYGKWMITQVGAIDWDNKDRGIFNADVASELVYITINEDGSAVYESRNNRNEFTWKNNNHPNHIFFEGIFKVLKVTNDTMIWYEDPFVIEEDFEFENEDEKWVVGIELKRMN